jgi:hypothetical protein
MMPHLPINESNIFVGGSAPEISEKRRVRALLLKKVI